MLDKLRRQNPKWFATRASIEHPMYWSVEQHGSSWIVRTGSGIYVCTTGRYSAVRTGVQRMWWYLLRRFDQPSARCVPQPRTILHETCVCLRIETASDLDRTGDSVARGLLRGGYDSLPPFA